MTPAHGSPSGRTREIVGFDGVRWTLTRDGSNRYPWRLTDGSYESFARTITDAERIVRAVEYGREKGTIEGATMSGSGRTVEAREQADRKCLNPRCDSWDCAKCYPKED